MGWGGDKVSSLMMTQQILADCGSSAGRCCCFWEKKHQAMHGISGCFETAMLELVCVS